MAIRALLTLSLVALTVSAAQAQFSNIGDDFESYGTDNDLYSVWEPRDGPGNGAPVLGDDGALTTDAELYPRIQGQGVDHFGSSVMQHTGLTPTSTITPTESESIRIQGDIFVGIDDGNSRMSIGLRNRTSTTNILEMGVYNATPIDPTDGVTELPNTNYAYRLVLFDELLDTELVQEPNWQYFQFDTALDIDDTDDQTEEPTPDGLVGLADIGPGWHRYSAIISPDEVTFEMDLFRDGLDNGATKTSGSPVAGVDASVSYAISSSTTGYDSFRLGAPSGISSASPVAFDNLCLAQGDASVCDFPLDDPPGNPADLNTDGFVDGLDLGILLGNFEQNADPSGGELNGTDPVDGLDLGILLGAWNPPSELSASSVPEPGTISLVLLALAGLTTARRR